MAYHPGTMLEEKLHEMGVTTEEFAQQTDIPSAIIRDVMNATFSVSADMAIAFENATSIPAKMWMKMQHSYDEYIMTEKKSSYKTRLEQLKKVAAILL